jgi:hypothetical protein
MYKDLKYLNEECITEKDATEKEDIRGSTLGNVA